MKIYICFYKHKNSLYIYIILPLHLIFLFKNNGIEALHITS